MNSLIAKVVCVARVVVAAVGCYFVGVFERSGYSAADGRLRVVVEEEVLVGYFAAHGRSHVVEEVVVGIAGCFVEEFDYFAVGVLDLGTVAAVELVVDFDTVAAVELAVVDGDTVAVGSNAADQDVDCSFDALDSVDDNSDTSPGNESIRQLTHWKIFF